MLEVNVLLAHAVGEPVMLIETDPGGERQIGAHAYEHAAPAPVVLADPAFGDLKVPAVDFLSPIAVMIRAGSRALRMTTT